MNLHSPRTLLCVVCWIGLLGVRAAVAQPCSAPAGGLAIPDADPIGVVDTLVVSSLDVISDLDVAVDIAHQFVGHLRVTLTHVDTGTTVVLRETLASCGSAGIQGAFDDEAATPGACPGSVPITGSLQPVGLLSAFDGEATAGTWELRLGDEVATSVGVLRDWCLFFTVRNRFCRQPAQVISDFPAAGVTDAQTIVAPFTAVGELSVVADISHPTVSDLVVTLTHVNTGTAVVLFDRGSCVDGDILTVFDDDAVVPAAGSCLQPLAVPFTVRPRNPLSAFAGEALAGQWRLQVEDLASGDTGTLNQWCLINSTTGDCPLVLCGDCDGNRVVTVLDALLAAQHAAGLISLHGTALANCNVVGAVEPAAGAAVDVLDSLLLAQFAAGLVFILNCC